MGPSYLQPQELSLFVYLFVFVGGMFALSAFLWRKVCADLNACVCIDTCFVYINMPVLLPFCMSSNMKSCASCSSITMNRKLFYFVYKKVCVLQIR